MSIECHLYLLDGMVNPTVGFHPSRISKIPNQWKLTQKVKIPNTKLLGLWTSLLDWNLDWLGFCWPGTKIIFEGWRPRQGWLPSSECKWCSIDTYMLISFIASTEYVVAWLVQYHKASNICVLKLLQLSATFVLQKLFWFMALIFMVECKCKN